MATLKESLVAINLANLNAVHFELDKVWRPFHFVQMEAFVEALATGQVLNVMCRLKAIPALFWTKM